MMCHNYKNLKHVWNIINKQEYSRKKVRKPNNQGKTERKGKTKFRKNVRAFDVY